MRVAMIWQHTEPRSLDEERVRIPSEVLIFLIYLIWLSLVFGNQRATAVASRLNMVFHENSICLSSLPPMKAAGFYEE